MNTSKTRAPVDTASRFPRKRGSRDRLVVLATLVVLAVLNFPILWIAVTSIRPADELLSRSIEFVPSGATLDAYRELLSSDFPRYLANSVMVCLTATVISVAISLLAAYAFSRSAFRGRKALLLIVAVSQLFPFVALVTPIYATFSRLDLVNSHLGLILAYLAITAPFSVYLLVGYLDAIPKELDEAAAIDGAGPIRTLFRVILPLTWPGLVVAATYAFIMAWEEYLFAAALMTDRELWTVPVGLATYFGEYSSRWDLIMAASVITSAPTLLLFLVLQRRLVSGLVSGAVK